MSELIKRMRDFCDSKELSKALISTLTQAADELERYDRLPLAKAPSNALPRFRILNQDEIDRFFESKHKVFLIPEESTIFEQHEVEHLLGYDREEPDDNSMAAEWEKLFDRQPEKPDSVFMKEWAAMDNPRKHEGPKMEDILARIHDILSEDESDDDNDSVPDEDPDEQDEGQPTDQKIQEIERKIVNLMNRIAVLESRDYPEIWN